MRPSNRAPDEMRTISITRNFTKHAEGSVLVEFGDTKVICTASVEDRVPGFLRGKGQGWVTAEYGMLPRSTGSRMGREAARDVGRDRPVAGVRGGPGSGQVGQVAGFDQAVQGIDQLLGAPHRKGGHDHLAAAA